MVAFFLWKECHRRAQWLISRIVLFGHIKKRIIVKIFIMLFNTVEQEAGKNSYSGWLNADINTSDRQEITANTMVEFNNVQRSELHGDVCLGCTCRQRSWLIYRRDATSKAALVVSGCSTEISTQSEGPFPRDISRQTVNKWCCKGVKIDPMGNNIWRA